MSKKAAKKTAKKPAAKVESGKFNPGKELPDAPFYVTYTEGNEQSVKEHVDRAGAISTANTIARNHDQTVHILVPIIKVSQKAQPQDIPVEWSKA